MSSQPWWLLLLVAAAAFVTPSGPGIFDAGELTSAVIDLGGSHPPGQPLHALLAHVFLWIPLGTLAFRVALFSAATEAASAWCVFALVRHWAPSSRIAPHAGALAALLSPPLLAQTTRVEVYGLALLLTLLAAIALCRWAEGDGRGLRVGALLAGLCVGVHPPHALAAIALGVALLFGVRRRFRGLPSATFFFVLGASVLAYLPLRWAAGAPMWGDPGTLSGFIDYVSGRAYLQNLDGTSAGLGSSLETLGFALLCVGALAAGWPAFARTGGIRRAVLAGSGLALIAGLLQRLDPQNPDALAYLAPSVALGIAAGAAGLATMWRYGSPNARRFALGALLVGGAHPWAVAVGAADLDQDAPVLETLASLHTAAPPPRALTIVETDFAAAAWMQARAEEGARPDVALFVAGLATSSWHWQTLSSHPIFDGAPLRGSGIDARAQYLDGAYQGALGRVPIVSETARLPLRVLVGPVVASSAAPNAYAERAFAHVTDAAGEARFETRTGAVLRDVLRVRAIRLAERSRRTEALSCLGRAYAFGPPPPPEDRGPGPIVPLVLDDASLLTGREDVVRVLAALAIGAGQERWAIDALGAQRARGDALGNLQLGYIALGLGDLALARRSLSAYEASGGDAGASLRAAIEATPQ